MLLGTHPPRLPAHALVSSAALFGISEGACRTALSRLVASGEITNDDGWYALGADLINRQRSQDVGRATRPTPWDGRWRTLIVTAERRSATDRTDARSRLRSARFAELREGIWTRPNNLPESPVVADLAGRGWLAAEVTFDDGLDPEDLWPLARWRHTAIGLHTLIEQLTPRLEQDDPSDLAKGFLVAAAGLRQFKSDPLLPDEVLPATWPGAEFREAYDRFDQSYRRVLRQFLQEAKGQTDAGQTCG